MGSVLEIIGDLDSDKSWVVLQHCDVLRGKSQEDNDRNMNTLLREIERRREENPVQQINGWIPLCFGQVIALIASTMNASSYVLEYGMQMVFPMFLLFNSYAILTLHLFWSAGSIKEQADSPRYRLPLTRLKLRTPWYQYLCLSFLDIVPNYLALLAIHRTSLTSATLLQSLTIPSTMIFCRLLLGKKYQRMHYIGVVLCMLGGGITILTDKGILLSPDRETPQPHSFSGDVLAILAALGYGVGDACAEFWSKHVNREEYLGMIGLFGAIWTLIASLLYERDAVLEAFATDYETFLRAAGVAACYVASLLAYYVTESKFLMKSDATLLNLSLQTQNFWAVLFSVFFFRETPHLPFYVAMILVVTGAFVYELGNNNEHRVAFKLDTFKANLDIATESTPLTSRNEDTSLEI